VIRRDVVRNVLGWRGLFQLPRAKKIPVTGTLLRRKGFESSNRDPLEKDSMGGVVATFAQKERPS
jgi:hypothetical protein